MSRDESVNLSKSESISWTKKLNPCQPNRIPIVAIVGCGGDGGGGGGSGAGVVGTSISITICWAQGGGDEKSYIVTRVHPHNLTSIHRPIQFINFPTWMLYHKRCCINGLTVPHFQSSFFYLNTQTGRRRRRRRKNISK